MWKKYADRALLALLPHLSCVLIKIAKHLKKRYGVCEICDICLCKIEKGEECEETC